MISFRRTLTCVALSLLMTIALALNGSAADQASANKVLLQ
jgi:hypothetical protein